MSRKWTFPTRVLPQAGKEFTISSLAKSPENVRALHLGKDGQWHEWAEVQGRRDCYLWQSGAVEFSADRSRYRVVPFGMTLYGKLVEVEIEEALAAVSNRHENDVVTASAEPLRALPALPPMPVSPALQAAMQQFEAALAGFCAQAGDSRANEATIQVWIALAMARAFGTLRVYREIHLHAPHLSEILGDHPFRADVKGNEIIPDLCIPWRGPIDGRHTLTRQGELKRAEKMLPQLAIITELKVTGSTSVPTAWTSIERDLRKLAVISDVYRSMLQSGLENPLGLACFMLLVDNFSASATPRPAYAGAALASRLERLNHKWPQGVEKPTIAVMWPKDGAMRMQMIREFALG